MTRARTRSRLLSLLAVSMLASTLVVLPPAPASAAPTDLLISEYVEGSSFNKAIEIYNGTGAAIDLSVYTLELYSNGVSSPSQSSVLSGSLADGDVYVLANSQADEAILDVADTTDNAVINFNGDDAVVLRKGAEVVDAFGQIGVQPDGEWPGGSENTTLRRMVDVCAGDTDPNNPFDTSVEWDGFAEDDFDGLGSHTTDCDGDPQPPTPPVTGIFISEYIEGSSNNKAIEIFNGTGSAIDLGAEGYNFQMFFNGSTSSSLTIDLTGTLAADDVFVLAHSSAVFAGEADQTSGAGFFNGDDAVVLHKGAEVVDVFGQIGFDPGSQWGSGLVSTQDNTLRRKADVVTGDTDGSDAFDPSVEWDGFAENTFDGLGFHGTPPPSPTSIVINEFSASTTETDVEYVEVFGTASTGLSDLTILQIEGDSGGGPGVVDEVIAVGTTDADGFWLADLASGTLENGSVSLLLVANFTGSADADLDTDNDGTLDTTPWDEIVDTVAVADGDSGDLTYGTTVLGPNYDGVSSFPPGGASRIPDGEDTDTSDDWVRNDFDLAGIPGSPGTPTVGEALNTPGVSNQAIETSPEPPVGACGDPALFIHEVQGPGLATPLTLPTSVVVEAIVVGDFQNNAAADDGDLNGFHLQEEDADIDGDPATSEGIFVFAPGGDDVEVGDKVRVLGAVSEFEGLTEITLSEMVACSDGNPAPTPASPTLPVDSLNDFEAYEGMSVVFSQELTISEYFNYDRFGEIVLTTDRQFTPTGVVEPGPAANALAEQHRLSRITLDDGRATQNPDPAIHPNGEVFDLTNLFRGGDTVTNVTGVMDYAFDLYRIQPTEGADYTAVNERPFSHDDVGGTLEVASFNVLNYFTTLDDGSPICGPTGGLDCRGANTAEEFERQQDKIVAALSEMDSDVVGLIEIENHPGDVPTANLVSALNDTVGAGTYDYIATGAIGTDAIRVALIYQSASVTPVGDFAILDSSVDPEFNDDKNRPVLAQTFVDDATGGVFTVAVNHLKSKGSDCNDLGDPDVGDGQGNCNLTRTSAAQALVDWLATDPTGSGDEDFLIMGDLNAYDHEAPIDAIVGAGYTDLIRKFLGEEAYSYVFDGRLGYLDHGLAGPGLVDEVTGATIWHINADEADLIDYDTTFKQNAQDAIYAPDPFRSSDHDPVIVGLGACDEIAPTISVDLSRDELWPPNHNYRDVTATVAFADNFDTTPTLELVSVTSNEPDNGADDGNTVDDIVIVDDTTFKLRAERSGLGDGRVYTVTYEVTDDCANTTVAEATVEVPLSKGGPFFDHLFSFLARILAWLHELFG